MLIKILLPGKFADSEAKANILPRKARSRLSRNTNFIHMKFKKNDFLDFTGKIGDYVVYEWRGQKCLRRKPREPKPPTSPRQVAQQERMASIAIFYQALKEVGIYPYWQEASKGQVAHGYNLLVKANLPAFNYEGLICDFTKLQLTPGRLRLPDGMELHAEADGSWRLTWTNTRCTPRTFRDDRLRLLLMRDEDTFDPEELDSGNATRADGEARFRIPEGLQDYPHLYAFFCSHTGLDCTKSRYFNLNLFINLLKSNNYGKI